MKTVKLYPNKLNIQGQILASLQAGRGSTFSRGEKRAQCQNLAINFYRTLAHCTDFKQRRKRGVLQPWMQHVIYICFTLMPAKTLDVCTTTTRNSG